MPMTHLHDIWASVCKWTAFMCVTSIRRHSFVGDKLFIMLMVIRHGVYQSACIRMSRIVKDFVRWHCVKHLSSIHYGYSVGDVCDHSQIMRNNDNRSPRSFL